MGRKPKRKPDWKEARRKKPPLFAHLANDPWSGKSLTRHSKNGGRKLISHLEHPAWGWSRKRILAAEIAAELNRSCRVHTKAAHPIGIIGKRSLSKNPRETHERVRRGKERGAIPDIPFTRGVLSAGTIWDSAHQIFWHTHGDTWEWSYHTHPAYRGTGALVAFDITDDPSEEVSLSPPFEIHVYFRKVDEREGLTRGYPVGVRLLDLAAGILVESLRARPYEDNARQAYALLEYARVHQKRKPMIPGVRFFNQSDWRHRHKRWLMGTIARMRNIDPDKEALKRQQRVRREFKLNEPARSETVRLFLQKLSKTPQAAVKSWRLNHYKPENEWLFQLEELVDPDLGDEPVFEENEDEEFLEDEDGGED
jgi:hypothetical protein